VEDNCRGILAVLERGRIGEVYNLGGSHVEENLSLARRLLRLVDKPETLLRYVADRPGHDRRYALDSTKIQAELAWKPEISLEQGLRQTIEWYKGNNKWVSDVRAGEYLSYYEKYYDDRDNALNAIVGSGSKLPSHKQHA
jgi:dTDP-glucose 4,6-dehydratase